MLIFFIKKYRQINYQRFFSIVLRLYIAYCRKWCFSKRQGHRHSRETDSVRCGAVGWGPTGLLQGSPRAALAALTLLLRCPFLAARLPAAPQDPVAPPGLRVVVPAGAGLSCLSDTFPKCPFFLGVLREGTSILQCVALGMGRLFWKAAERLSVPHNGKGSLSGLWWCGDFQE